MVPGMADNALSGSPKMGQTALGILYILSPALSPFQKRMSNVDKGRGVDIGEHMNALCIRCVTGVNEEL